MKVEIRNLKVGMIGAVFGCALLSGLPVGASTLDVMYEALEARGIVVDRQVADRAAASAALATIDARASVVDPVSGTSEQTNAPA